MLKLFLLYVVLVNPIVETLTLPLSSLELSLTWSVGLPFMVKLKIEL